MLPFLKKTGHLNIGLDVGTKYIKAVAIDNSKTPPELVAISCVSVGEDSVASIKKATTELGVSSSEVATSLAGSSTIVRVIEMPVMAEKEFKNVARFEAEKYIPYKLDEVTTDCDKIEDLGGGKMNVLLVAAKKSMVTDRIKLLSEAGLTASIVDIDSFATMNALLSSQKIDDNKTCALLDIGAKVTNLNIIKGGYSYLVRDISAGGEDITKAISEQLAVEIDKAETLKINATQEQKTAINSAIKGTLFNLINEIRLSFDFYENHYGKNVQEIYISGGSSKLNTINELIKDIFNGEIIAWDPFNNLSIGPKINTEDLKSLKSSFAVAIGLGLRES